MKLKAVLFDIDGTLLDTHEYIYQSFEHSLGKHHKPLPRKVIQTIMGKPLEECYRILTKLENVENLANSHHGYQLANPNLVTPFPHTISTLEYLKKMGILIAAITTRGRNTVDGTLEQTGIIHYLNYVVAIDDVINPKPDPEGIRKALTYFEVKPEEAMMVGDSDVDVLAAQNAGVRSIAAAYGFHGKVLSKLNPDYLIDDIGEIVQIVKNL